MAATRLITMHQNKGQTVANSLEARLDYATNSAKTENGQYVSSYACDPRTADQEFALAKQEYLRITGRRIKGDILAYQMDQAKEKAAVSLEALEKNKSIWRHNSREWKGTKALREKEEKLAAKKLKIYDQYKSGKLSRDTYLIKFNEISQKLESVRFDLAEIERKAKEGEYNLTASIEIEKMLKKVIELENFDKDVLLNVVDKVVVKEDGTEEIFWKKVEILDHE